MQIESAATGESKAVGLSKADSFLVIDSECRETKRRNSLKRNPERRTHRDGVNCVDIPKMRTSLDHPAEVLVHPIGAGDREPILDSLIAIDGTIGAEI